MKCPKCGYLGFETSDRCRNCGYDFSLAVDVAPLSELPLRSSDGAGAALEDFDLGEADTKILADSNAAELDLDRIIGETPATAGPRDTRGAAGGSTPTLPLFGDADDDTPLITSPRPPRPPLSVRRTTPEIPRGRARVTTARGDDDDALAFPSEVAEALPPARTPEPPDEPSTVSSSTTPVAASARLVAALVDIVLLGAINGAVIYLTLAMSGLTMADFSVLPILPMITFFAILDGGYLVGFIAASGQTIGKMITGIRVLSDDGQRVSIGTAAIRAAGCGLSLLTAGVGYVPAFLTADGRALQDRISRTRVVSAR
jgi:uncharacterized RDD family membrane protein YckC